MNRPRRFKSANYPVAGRRHLLVPGTGWISGTGGVHVVLTNVYEYVPNGGEQVCIARVPLPGSVGFPRASRIAVTSFLRNYRREDEDESTPQHVLVTYGSKEG